MRTVRLPTVRASVATWCQYQWGLGRMGWGVLPCTVRSNEQVWWPSDVTSRGTNDRGPMSGVGARAGAGVGEVGGSMSHGGGQSRGRGEALYIFRGYGAYAVSRALNARKKAEMEKRIKLQKNFCERYHFNTKSRTFFQKLLPQTWDINSASPQRSDPICSPHLPTSGNHGWLNTHKKNRKTFAEILRRLKPWHLVRHYQHCVSIHWTNSIKIKGRCHYLRCGRDPVAQIVYRATMGSRLSVEYRSRPRFKTLSGACNYVSSSRFTFTWSALIDSMGFHAH